MLLLFFSSEDRPFCPSSFYFFSSWCPCDPAVIMCEGSAAQEKRRNKIRAKRRHCVFFPSFLLLQDKRILQLVEEGL